MNNTIRVAFISRPSLFKVPGGDTVQMQNTAASLRDLGVNVDLYTADQQIDYRKYDLLHFFNITRPASILKHSTLAQVPFVLSPIYIDYAPYERNQGSRTRRVLSNAFGKHRMEYFKVLGRYVKNREPIGSNYYLSRGQSASIRRVLRHCAYVLPNSDSEANRLFRDFPGSVRWKAVPNAVETGLFKFKGHENRDAKTVLCVGRFEGSKNQLSLIRALKGTGVKLVLAGACAPNQLDYYKQCVKEADESVSFLGSVPQDQLVDLYNQAEVHALPSWFETTGLSSLEAALCGCKVVMSRNGDEYDYFEDYAFYVKPGSVEHIRETIQKALAAPRTNALREKVSNEYTWKRCAELTLQTYKEVLR